MNKTNVAIMTAAMMLSSCNALQQKGENYEPLIGKQNITIKDGRVTTKPFDIKLGDYNLNLSGSTGLDQSIDYAGKVNLPASTGIGKFTTLDLKIGGSFTSPKVSIDTKSMANQAVETVANEAISKIGQKLGLDSATTANKDSLKKKVTEKATEKALDFLKKKLK